MHLSVTNFKKIRVSSLILTFCILQWSTHMVESAITAANSNGKSVYASADGKGRAASSSVLGSIYQRSRQSRCVTCYENRLYGDDRSRYYSNPSARSGDDRTSSWYYPRYDRYDDRSYRGTEQDRYGSTGSDRYGGYRYGADRYGGDRYDNSDRYYGYRDDNYGARPSYDRYETRTRDPYERPAAYDRGESRGYSYDNRDRYYGSDRDPNYYYSRDRYYDRPRYSATRDYGGYDRDYYDRYSRRRQPAYDSSSYDSYYNKDTQQDRRYLPERGYNTACGIRKPNCPYNPPEEGTRVTSGPIDSGHYNMGVSQTTYNTHSNTNHNESAKGSSAGWSYLREDEKPSRDDSNSSGSYASSNNMNRDRSSDQQRFLLSPLIALGTALY